MKVLLVAPQPFYRERGTPIAVKLLVEELCSAGHQVDLLVYHDGDDISISGMRLFRAGRPPGIGRVPIGLSVQKLVCDLWLIGKMLQLLRLTKYDVIHAVEEAIFPATLLRKWFRTRLVYDMDSSLSSQITEKWAVLRPLRRVLEAIENPFFRRADMVLAVCEDLAARMHPLLDARRIVVLPDVPMADEGGDFCDRCVREGASPSTVVGLYVGNLERYQGIDLLLDSLRALPASCDFRMVVIGGLPDHIARYEAIAARQGLGDRLKFLGPRPLAHLGGYLAQADVLVSPRILGQNTPMKIYSYMQAGKAILATDIRSHTQALTAGSALLVPSTPQGMAAGLERLVNEPALRETLGQGAQLRAEQEFSIHAFRSRLISAYARLVDGSIDSGPRGTRPLLEGSPAMPGVGLFFERARSQLVLSSHAWGWLVPLLALVWTQCW